MIAKDAARDSILCKCACGRKGMFGLFYYPTIGKERVRMFNVQCNGLRPNDTCYKKTNGYESEVSAAKAWSKMNGGTE